jgi:predicted nucleotidyltransferase component of viral defense system
MSDLKTPPHVAEYDIVDVDIRAWVETARSNPAQYRDRQVTEIVLTSIGLAPTLSTNLVLKGGTVMALAFRSNRVTADVDFTSIVEPAGFADQIAGDLNAMLPQTAIRLGYLNLLCRVQTVKKMPRSSNFIEYDFPALLIRVGSAERGTGEEKRLKTGAATRVLDIEISFRDQVYAFQELNLTGAGVAVRAFTLHEIIAEKIRALLQQPIRKRNRRQDVYDIAYLIEVNELTNQDRSIILETLIEKCQTRGINAKPTSIDDPEIRERAQADWNTLALELGDLPPFDERYAVVRELYVSLPWELK